jgi:hypothetical protein
MASSEVMVYVDVAVLRKEERRGYWSVEAFGEEVLVHHSSPKMRVSSMPGNGGDGAKQIEVFVGAEDDPLVK